MGQRYLKMAAASVLWVFTGCDPERVCAPGATTRCQQIGGVYLR